LLSIETERNLDKLVLRSKTGSVVLRLLWTRFWVLKQGTRSSKLESRANKKAVACVESHSHHQDGDVASLQPIAMAGTVMV
jgi:hypothetical protein